MFNEFSRYEDDFREWTRSGYPGAKPETLDYIGHISDAEDDTQPREGTLWPHQWDSFLRVIYAYEIERNALALPNGILLNVVTGGGKTAIIAALIAWLRLAHDVQKFLLLCPNLIVRDRLEEDFQDGKVFADRDLIPEDSLVRKDDFALTTLGSDRPGGLATLLGASVIPGKHSPVLCQQRQRTEQSIRAYERTEIRAVQRRGAQLTGSRVGIRFEENASQDGIAC